MTLRVSHSGMETFRACPMAYMLSRVEKVEACKKPVPLARGSAMHEALNMFHHGLLMDGVLDVWHDAWRRWGLAPSDGIIGELLLLAYSEAWPRKNGKMEIEAEFCVPVQGPDGPVEGVEWVGFIDIKGQGWLVDHKTTGAKLTPSKVASLARDPQAEEYIIATNGECTKAVWDIIRWPGETPQLATPLDEQEFYKRDCKGGKKGDPKKGTFLEDETQESFRERMVAEIANGKYFDRQIIEPHESQLEKRRYDIWATALAIKAATETGAFHRNENSCERFGGCEYKPVCWDGVDPHASPLYRIRKRR